MDVQEMPWKSDEKCRVTLEIHFLGFGSGRHDRLRCAGIFGINAAGQCAVRHGNLRGSRKNRRAH